MIGRLRGALIHRQAPFILLDVGGVGYEVEVTTGAFCRLPPPGAECILYVHMIVREDAQLLYGFADLPERTLFRSLIRVNGIGSRTALGIVSAMPVADFVRCVRDSDTAALMRLPGIGRKSAERLVVEMRDRLDDHSEAEGVATDAAAALAVGTDPVREAIAALEALGYRPQEAVRMVRAIEGEDLDSGELIRRALQRAVVRPA